MTSSEIYPLRRGYAGVAPPEVVQVVRKVLSDWDGVNWGAVRDNLEFYFHERGLSLPNLDDWTLSKIRQHYAQRNKLMVLTLGGTVATHTGDITETKWNTVQAQRVLLGERPGSVRYSEFREPQEWLRLRKLKGLSHSRNTWQTLLEKHGTDIDCESTKSARISFALAQTWGLSLPEFNAPATQ